MLAPDPPPAVMRIWPLVLLKVTPVGRQFLDQAAHPCAKHGDESFWNSSAARSVPYGLVCCCMERAAASPPPPPCTARRCLSDRAGPSCQAPSTARSPAASARSSGAAADRRSSHAPQLMRMVRAELRVGRRPVSASGWPRRSSAHHSRPCIPSSSRASAGSAGGGADLAMLPACRNSLSPCPLRPLSGHPPCPLLPTPYPISPASLLSHVSPPTLPSPIFALPPPASLSPRRQGAC